MKIGILTFHRANNLGAVLQAYALQSKIKEIYNNVEIIDYDNGIFREKSNDKGIKKYIKKMYYIIKNYSFEEFRKKNMLMSKKYDKNTIFNCNNEYDCIICGSDQIWNLECSGYDYNYFLKFADKKIQRVSYAASVGTYHFSKGEKKIIAEELKKYNKISIRERDSLTQFDDMELDKKVNVLCDPVFLLTDNDWLKIYNKRIEKHKYIFVYLIQEDVNVMRAAIKYAKENDCKLITNKKSLKFILNNSPDRFLSWIYYADAVFTNSFHGSAFSIIFNKKFGADIRLKNGNINNRINELLKLTKNENCIINEEKVCSNSSNSELYKLRENSISYLKKLNEGE